MKIIIEPTSDPETFNSVSVANMEDHINLDQVIELMISTIVAWGFNRDAVVRSLDNVEL